VKVWSGVIGGLELHVREMHKYDVDQVARMADAFESGRLGDGDW